MSMSYRVDVSRCDGKVLPAEVVELLKSSNRGALNLENTTVHLSGRLSKSDGDLIDSVAKACDGLVCVYSSEASLYEEKTVSVSLNGVWCEIYKDNSHVIEWQHLYHDLKKWKGDDPDDAVFIERMRSLIGEELNMKHFDLTELEVLNRKEQALKDELKKIADEKKKLKRPKIVKNDEEAASNLF